MIEWGIMFICGMCSMVLWCAGTLKNGWSLYQLQPVVYSYII